MCIRDRLESSGMKDALIKMKPTNIEDIVALVALYRPGPMSNIPIYNDCKNGISKDVAAGIFLKIEPFAEYGFNKSHAAAYAVIAFQTAYLKTYFPHEFFAASMSMELSNQKKLSEFYEELRRLNIEVVRPDINECFAEFKALNGKIYYGLGCLLYTSPSPRDRTRSRMPSSA